MKKAVAWLMLLSVMTIFTLSAAAPVKADVTRKDIYAASPHPYSDWWWANKMLVGWVTVWNDGDYLYVKYETTGGWELTETHLAVADSFDDIPQTKKGNPKVGRFPYKMMHDPSVTEYTYVIDLTWSADTELIIAAHAVVELRSDGCVLQETAWADCGGIDAQFPGNNWATYITYVVQD